MTHHFKLKAYYTPSISDETEIAKEYIAIKGRNVLDRAKETMISKNIDMRPSDKRRIQVINYWTSKN